MEYNAAEPVQEQHAFVFSIKKRLRSKHPLQQGVQADFY